MLIGEIMFSGLLGGAVIYFTSGKEITYHYLGDKPARCDEDWSGSGVEELDEFIELHTFLYEKIMVLQYLV